MSNKAILAQGTTLHVAGSSSSPLNLVSCAAGYPTILTFANATVAAALNNGDSVTIAAVSGTDAALLNVITTVTHKAIGATNTTFTVDIDTTGKTVVGTAATATPAAWIKVGELSGIEGSSDSAAEVPTTDLDSVVEESVQGLATPGNISMNMYCVDSDTGLTALEAAFDARLTKQFKVTYPSGSTPIRSFSGYLKSYPKVGKANVNGIISGSVEIKRTTVVTKS